MSNKSPWQRIWGRRFPLETETAWFVLVNVLDIVVTWIMLRSGTFRESNPIALYFLNHWGIRGMNLFKLGSVVLVVVIAQIVAVSKPGTARALLILGTTVVAAVVCYSVTMALGLSRG